MLTGMTLEDPRTDTSNRGSLVCVCVGIGMTLGSHLSPLARSYIEKADVVFAAVWRLRHRCT